MKMETIETGNTKITYFVSDDILVKTINDVLDLMANADSDYLAFHDYNFEADFFDLSSLKLGEILQKFTNYRVKVAIIGNFDIYPSKVLRSFISESNRHGEYIFVSSLDDVKQKWFS